MHLFEMILNDLLPNTPTDKLVAPFDVMGVVFCGLWLAGQLETIDFGLKIAIGIVTLASVSFSFITKVVKHRKETENGKDTQL